MGFQCVKSVSEVVVLAKDHNRGLGCAVSLAFPSLTHRLSYLGSCILQGRHQSLISSFLFFPQTRTLSNSGWPKTDGSWIALRNWNRVRVVRWASCLCAELSERKGPTARKSLDRQNSMLEHGAVQKTGAVFNCSHECVSFTYWNYSQLLDQVTEEIEALRKYALTSTWVCQGTGLFICLM